MSLTERSTSASQPKSPSVDKHGVDEHAEDDPSDKSTKGPGDKHGAGSSPDRTVMDRVLKQVGTTSSTFIGPAFPPPRKTAPKSDIEDSLSEFYKELESVEKTDAANGDAGTQDSVKKPPNRISQDCVDGESCNKRVSHVNDFHLKSKRQKPSPPHWYHNQPYNVRAPRPGQETKYGEAGSHQNHWFPPPPLHPPPFHHQPPSYAFPPPPLHGDPRFRMTNHYQQPGFPPCNVPSQPTFEGKPCRPIDRNQQFYNNTDSRSDPHPTYREQRTDQWSQMKQTHRTGTDEDVWERHHHYEPQDQRPVRHPAPLLILMRGLPGCGKSTRARELLSTGPSGVILSTDDYFLHEHGYRYELGRLGAAHEWNQHRAKDALNEGRSPVIIDNTNLQAWEMKPYVKMALERGYTVDFCEPQTSWKFDPSELERRNKHKVPREKIAQMMDRYSFPISVDVVMSSEEPPHVAQKQQQQQQHRPPQTMRRQHDFH